jgi:predicted ATPase/signal transduction histidine kinase
MGTDYVITEPLRDEANVAIYHGQRVRDHLPVVIKLLGPRRRLPRDLERLRNEFEIASRLNTPSVVEVLALETLLGAPALILRDFGGRALAERPSGAPMELEPFLRLAVALAGAVADVHTGRVVHKDLKPENILVNDATGEVKITDFELASLLPCEGPAAIGPHIIEGSLPYMSPEQTGRTNHGVDQRTDLYSLGITLFELRAGRLPFEASDPLGWIHCHLARIPPSLAQVAPGTPEMVSQIVARLLAKAPEDRYQSARGLQRDLACCLERWLVDGQIAPFPLAALDLSDDFQLPRRLYGREREIAALVRSFEGVVATGTPALALISGYAGVGKTSLVQELRGPVLRARGFLVTGKFDLQDRLIPYSTLVEAWRDLLRELLSEPVEERARWGQRFREALGINARLMIDLLPELEPLIGPQSPVPALPLAEAERRFQMVVQQFVGVLAAPDHPLVQFLDDIQWADSASLKLTQALLTGGTRHLLIVAAYRDNEVPPTHPVHAMVATLRQAGTAIETVSLGPLERAQVVQLVADTVRTGLREAEPLGARIHETTAGNAFFVTQLLTSLHQHGLFRLDQRSGCWRWEAGALETHGLTTNIVDLMVSRLQGLPETTRRALELAACGAASFDEELLATICASTVEQARRNIWEAVQAGVLVRIDGGYRFVHDRVQEVAYSFIAADRRTQVHLEIGRRLLAGTPAEHLPRRVFQIVGQLDRALELVDDAAERERLAELNLLAGRRARTAAAYASAVEFLAAGVALVGQDGWEKRYELTYRLHLERAECEYLNNDLEGCEALLSVLLARARSRSDRAAVYVVAVQLHATKGQVERSLACTLECLRDHGISISTRPDRHEVEAEYLRVLEQVEARSIEALVHLPLMTDPETTALMGVLTVSTAPVFFIGFEIYASLVCLGVRLSLERGNIDGSAHLYTAFGAVVGVLFGRYDEARRLGLAGLALVERRNLMGSRARASYVYAGFVSLWVEPIETTLRRLDQAIHASIETGNFTFASYAALTLIALQLLEGKPLEEVQREIERRLASTARARATIVIPILEANLRFVRELRGQVAEPAAELERRLLPVGLVLFNHHLRVMESQYILGEDEETLAAAARARPLLWSAYTLPHCADFAFFHALALIRSGQGEGLDEDLRRLSQWAESAPENFAARAQLVSAELARAGGRELEAMHLYEQAIQGAHARGFVPVEAIARELAAAFYRERGYTEIARGYLREARACYARWGAEVKLRQLDRDHPGLAGWTARGPGTFIARAAELDLMAVLAASQRISGEIVLDELSRTLIRLLLEQGGAQRGCLLLSRQGRPEIEAMAELRDDGMNIELRPEMSLAEAVPATMVEHVANTGERVILDDAVAEPGRFAGDPYLARRRPRSVLCLPIRHRAQAVGYLYLENPLVPAAFTPDRLTAAELLASQAAISLENAGLLRQEAEARHTAEAAKARAESAEQRAVLLAEAGALLAESLDYEDVLSRVARLLVRSLADWCQFDLIEEGKIQRRAGTHADPTRVPALARLAEQYPPRWDSPHPQLPALRDGKVVLIGDASDEYIRAHTIDAEHASLVRTLGFSSGIVVPLRSRERILGALTLVSASPGRRYQTADLELAEELARRAAMAVDNALLYREARRAIRLREEFLAVASHELRTPLTSLMLDLEALDQIRPRRPDAGDPLSQTLESITRQAGRLGRQVNDLLDVTRIDAGRLALNLAEADLVVLVENALRAQELARARAGCPVRLEAPAPVPGQWDPARLEQVVSNLLANALKFGAGGPVEISVSRRDGIAVLSVTDHGIGIDPAQLEHVFDKFTRAVPVTHFGGLGLGLYISRQIVAAHGGTIQARSRPGAGSTFTVELPIAGAAS